MNLDHNFFQVSKLSEDQKKGLHQNWKTFSPRILMKTSARMQTRVKLLGGMAVVDHTQIIGGYKVKFIIHRLKNYQNWSNFDAVD